MLACWKGFLTVLYHFLVHVRHDACFTVPDDMECSYDIFSDLENSTYFIGGIIPAHRSKDNQHILNNPAILWASAIVHTIQEINKNSQILPNIQLGYDIRDSRNKVSCASSHALDFLLDQPKQSKLLGVVGPASSSLSAAVSTILLPDFIPQVSYSATSTELSERSIYRNFLRTAPTDAYQAKAMVDLLVHFEWKFVSLFASNDDYGYFGQQEIRKVAKERNVCFSIDKSFNEDIGQSELREISELIKKHSKVVILWCSVDDAAKIIREAIDCGLQNITWIGTEQWASSTEIIQLNISHYSHNILCLRLQHQTIGNLEEDIWNAEMPSDINCKNPWYREFLSTYSVDCPEIISFAKLLPNKKQAQVVAAVYALAYGLHEYLNCTNTECLADPQIDYKDLYMHIIKTNFTIPTSSFSMKFDSLGEVVSPVYEYSKVFNNSFKNFGSWKSINKNLVVINIDKSLISWPHNHIPNAVCASNCLPGTYRVNSTTSKCCWICETCPLNTVSSAVNQYECTKCSATTVINENRTRCNNLLEIRLRMNKSEGLFIAIGSAVGVFCSVFVLALFIIYWDTPLVKSSNREMSTIQLVSILGLFCLSFFYFMEPVSKLCMIRTMLFGFFFTTVVALVFIKTYRLLRVFNGRFTKVSRFLENKYQIAFSFLLVLLQTIAVFLWYIYFPAKVTIVTYPQVNLFCRVCDHEVFWGMSMYIFLLVIVNGYMAFRARKLPENFNEAQHIAYAMFTLCILWLSYLPLYISLEPHERQVAFLSINLVASFCSLFILYWMKVIIILFYPSLNSQQSFRKTAEKSVLRNFIQDVQRSDGTSESIVRSVIMFEEQPRHQRKFSLPCFDSTDYIGLKEGFPLQRSFSHTSTDRLDYDTFPVTTSVSQMKVEKLKDESPVKSASKLLLKESSLTEFPRPKSQLFFNKGMMSAASSLHSLSSFLTGQNQDNKEESKGLLNESEL